MLCRLSPEPHQAGPAGSRWVSPPAPASLGPGQVLMVRPPKAGAQSSRGPSLATRRGRRRGCALSPPQSPPPHPCCVAYSAGAPRACPAQGDGPHPCGLKGSPAQLLWGLGAALSPAAQGTPEPHSDTSASLAGWLSMDLSAPGHSVSGVPSSGPYPFRLPGEPLGLQGIGATN